MELKDPRHFGHWVFYIGGKTDSDVPEMEVEELRIPSFGYANTKTKLVNMIMIQLLNLASQGINGYLVSLQEEAASYNLPTKEFLSKLVEHQICLRGGRKSGMCWDTGWGDKVHSGFGLVDDLISKAPSSVKKVYQKIIKIVATPTVLGRVSSCRSCGGSRSLKINKNNRGRSGRF